MNRDFKENIHPTAKARWLSFQFIVKMKPKINSDLNIAGFNKLLWICSNIPQNLTKTFVLVNVVFNLETKKMLNITERQKENATILDLEGNIILGGGSQKLGQEVRRLIEAGKTNFLLNFNRVKYIDSSGVGELFSLTEMINQAEGNLKLINLPPKVEEVLTLSGVLPMFEIADDENAS